MLFFTLALSPLVFVHELGHYAVGRLFGVKADIFSIGFGQSVASWMDKRGTRWQIGWLPLGGYVKFAGDLNAASEPNAEWMSLPADERNRTFQAKPLWQRALIIFAGPAVNFLFAMLVMGTLFSIYGEPRMAPVLGGIIANSPAAQAGLRPGDRIVSVDGQAIDQFEDIMMLVQVRSNVATPFVIQRGPSKMAVVITPRSEKLQDLSGASVPVGRIGAYPAGQELVKLSPAELPGAVLRFTVDSVRRIVVGLGQIIVGQRSVQELGGPIKIAKVSNAVAQYGFVSFLAFMAAVSINLGFINLLPIPVLDGGHLAFYAVEAVRRKPVGVQAQEWAYRSGLLVLLAFMLFVTINDLGGLGLFGRVGG